jgi:hypothetical protein
LVAGFADQERTISAVLAREVIDELAGKPRGKSLRIERKRAAAIVGIVGALVALLGGMLYWQLNSLLAWYAADRSYPPQLDNRALEPQEKTAALQQPLPAMLVEPQNQGQTNPLSLASSLDSVDGLSSILPAKPSTDGAALPSVRLPASRGADRQEPARTAAVKTEAPTSAQSLKAMEQTLAPTFPVTRIVKRGDSLSKMIASVYGRSSSERVQWVKAHNPDIQDEHNLEVGQTITFPALDDSVGRQ